MIRAVIAAIFVILLLGFVVAYSETLPLSMNTDSATPSSNTVSGLLFDREMTVYPTYVDVTDDVTEIGISGDTDKLDFGIVPHGAASRKMISIVNPRDTKVQVRVEVNNLSMVKAESGRLSVMPHENVTVGILANITDSTASGEYKGSLSVFVIIPRYPFLSELLW